MNLVNKVLELLLKSLNSLDTNFEDIGFSISFCMILLSGLAPHSLCFVFCIKGAPGAHSNDGVIHLSHHDGQNFLDDFGGDIILLQEPFMISSILPKGYLNYLINRNCHIGAKVH